MFSSLRGLLPFDLPTIGTIATYIVTSYLVLIITLFVLSSFILPKLAFYARLLSSFFSLLVCAAYGVVVSILLRVVGYGQVSQWATARCFKWVMWFTTGVMFVVVEGKEHLDIRPAVFIGNHQTELDVLLLGSVMPPYCSVTAKKSLKNIPMLGWFMALSKTVFIDRSNRQTAVAAFDGAANVMRRERQSVYIFPEGTRSYFSHPDLLPFKKGAFHLAVNAQVPIIPVVVANYSHVFSFGQKVFHPGVIPVKVLKPIRHHLTLEKKDPHDGGGGGRVDVDWLTRDTRQRMLMELKSLSERAI